MQDQKAGGAPRDGESRVDEPVRLNYTRFVSTTWSYQMAKKAATKGVTKAAAKAASKGAPKLAPKGAARSGPVGAGSRVRTRVEWTKANIRELKTLAREKTPVRTIAANLGRTEGAVRQKAFAEGISLSLRRRK